MDNRYGITEMARLLGISTEALRKYEEKNILTSFRNDDTNYREYSDWEFSTLLQARAFRQMGFSLQKTAALLNDSDVSEIVELFEQQKARLSAEILYRERMFHRLEQLQKEAQDCVSLCGRYRLEYRPAVRFVPFYDGLKFGDDALKAMGKAWAEHLALVSIFFIYRPDFYRATGQYVSGIALEKNAPYSGAAKGLPYAEALPARLCVVTSMEGTYTHKIEPSDFSGALAFIRQQGYQLTGEVTAKVVYTLKKDGEYRFWHKLYFPIDQPAGETRTPCFTVDNQPG